MKYYATVDDNEYIIEVVGDEIVVNGDRYDVDFREVSGVGMVSLIINHHSLESIVEDQEDGTSNVLIKGELYSVKVQDERAYRLAQARGLVQDVSGDAAVKSPMPGIIIATPVAVGDTVAKGEAIVILESMKMENELKSPRDGVVLSVEVSAGDSVEKGHALVVIGDG